MADYRGTSGSDTYTGTDDAETIYGYPEAGTPPSKVIASDLYRPLFATAPEGDTNRLFVVSQGGAIKIHDLNDPEAAPQTFLDISSRVNNNTEAGLLGFTFHPDFATNGKCYVNYTTPDNAEETGRKQAIVEYTFNPNDLSQAPTEKTIMVIDYPQEHTHHRAGWLGFGPDEMLYIATGEDTVAANAQTVVNQDGSINHLGKMLRIDVSGDGFPADANRNYRIPADNPTAFDNISGELAQPSEIWAVGLRNPWRASFGPDGKLYVADVGQNTYEEINIVEAGKNYGWRPVAVGDGPQNTPGYTDPYHYYGRDIGGSVTGGYFYSGQGPLNGKYIFGDFNNGHIFAMDVSGAEPDVDDITNLFRDANGNPLEFGHLSSFGLDGQGNLYAISYADNTWGNDTGRIFRLSDNTPVSDVGDELNGAGGNDTIYGGDGNDTLLGGDDDDHIHGDADDDYLSGDAGNDEIHGGAGNDTFAGGDDDDHIFGEAGNDVLWGDEGADTLDGGSGNDLYNVDGGDTVVEAVNGGHDEILVWDTFTLQAGQEVEVLKAVETSDEPEIDLTGNEFAQELIGNSSANRLDGKGGADTMSGSDGSDTYVVDNAQDRILESDAPDTDTVESTIDYVLGEYLENLVLQGTAINGTGNLLDNSITGNVLDNVLNGGGGVDTLSGGDGNDTYVVDHAEDEIDEVAGKGTDTLISSISYELADGVDVEILKVAGGNGAIDLTGNVIGNILHGNAGANRLDGGGGDDTVVFTGNRAHYTVTDNGDGSITIADGRTNGDGTDTILRTELFKFADRTLSLVALLNADPTGILLDQDVVTENRATGSGFATISASDTVGDTLRFELTNTAGGRFAIDSITGMIRVADGTKLDYEQARQHTISVRVTDQLGGSATKSFTVRVQDDLNERATGSSRSDVMKGGSGSDSFNGLGGNDRLDAGAGKDTLTGGSGNDSLVGGSGNDRLNGESGNDSLSGGSGNDSINASSGNDRLSGGLGKDTLTGGTGRDVFVFDDKETGSSKSKADYITDFSGRNGDRIDLKLVDADSKKRGDQKFSFIGEKAFTKAGQVRYEKTKKETYVYLNTDNDKAAEAVIKLKGSFDLQKGWFVL